MLVRMDSDAPHPHCPFCGFPMHAKPVDNYSIVHCTRQAFDCHWCGVVLNVSAQAEILELAAPALARG